jgi:3-dehydroquinate synthase
MLAPSRLSAIIYHQLVKKIPVRTRSAKYQVIIGAGLLQHAGKEIKRMLPLPGSRVFVVTSPNVRHHWGEKLEASLQKARLSYQVLEMKDGEPAKRMQTVEQLAEQLVELKADRKSLIVAFGGGVVGDSAGFLAAIFMRGIPVVQLPTTVVAQLDASIGGKTGVNLRSGKNLVGAFHQPRLVVVDPELLQTLDEREFRSGLFEALKCGVIRDAALFEFMDRNAKKILNRDSKALERIITDSVRVKANVVSADEKESGLRRILNFGHTIGHALESATGYTHFLHGEAVAWGMIAAAEIAHQAGICKRTIGEKVQQSVLKYGPLPPVPCSVEDVLSRLASDKKTIAGAVHFILPQKIGKVRITSKVPGPIVRSAVEMVRNHA